MAQKQSFVNLIRPLCEKLAQDQNLEFCDVQLEKEQTGNYLRIYLDKEGGLTLDDCEAYHRAVMPLVEKYDYDFLEVCSLGIDRPIKTERDALKCVGLRVEVRLYKPLDGQKIFEGDLVKMDAQNVVITDADQERSFERKSVALVKLVPDLSALDESEEEITES